MDKRRTKNRVQDNASQTRQIGEPPRPQSHVSVWTKGRQKNTEVGWLPIVMNNNEKSTAKTRKFWQAGRLCPQDRDSFEVHHAIAWTTGGAVGNQVPDMDST